MTEDKIALIKLALEEWHAGKLKELTTLIIIDSLINPVTPSAEDIKLAQEDLNENTPN